MERENRRSTYTLLKTVPHVLISVMYGTPNNSIHEFGITKKIILAGCKG